MIAKLFLVCRHRRRHHPTSPVPSWLKMQAPRRWSRSRSSTDRFDGAALLADLEPYARDKLCSWDWELTSYSKTRRSQAPDRAGMVAHRELLSCILRHSPAGFPNFTLLRDCWLELNKRFEIRSKGVLASKQDIEWASDAADAIRLMCKHVVDLRRSGTQFVSSEISALIELIGANGDQLEAPLPLPAPSAAPPAPERRTLAPQNSDASVIVCAIACNCPLCRVPVDVEMSQQSATSSTSRAALAATPVPATRGGQKRAALEVRSEDEQAVQKKPSQKKQTVKKPAAALDYRVIHRATPSSTRPCEAYILGPSSKFVCSLSAKRSPNYLQLINIVANDLNVGLVKEEAARGHLATLLP